MELLMYSALEKCSVLLCLAMRKGKDRRGDELIVQFTSAPVWEKGTTILCLSVRKEALLSPPYGLFASQYPQ